jgi:hypothetical protein
MRNGVGNPVTGLWRSLLVCGRCTDRSFVLACAAVCCSTRLPGMLTTRENCRRGARTSGTLSVLCSPGRIAQVSGWPAKPEG